MSLFRDELGVSTSYIHRIEQGSLVPDRDRVLELGQVFRQVAVQQNAAEPEADVRALERARELAVIVEQHGVDQTLAELLLVVRDAEPAEPDDPGLRELLHFVMEVPTQLRTDVFSALKVGAPLLLLLAPEQRSGALRYLESVLERLGGLPSEETKHAVMELADELTGALDLLPVPDAGATAPDSAKREPESAARASQTSHGDKPVVKSHA